MYTIYVVFVDTLPKLTRENKPGAQLTIFKISEVQNMGNTTITTVENAKKAIRDILTTLDDSDIITMWNEYCAEVNRYDDEIMTYYDLKEYIVSSSRDVMSWLNRFYFGSDDYSQEGSANPNRDYFTFNGYGNIISFDIIYNNYSDEFNYIDEMEMIEYIINNQNSFYNDEIQEIIDALEEIEE